MLANVRGTRLVAEASARHDAETFIFISTDKAVDPSSVMGATKRMGELLVQEIGAGATGRFVLVRFGNVMGSQGSVLELFRQQIADGGPVTVTHPDMTRYFMTIPEAVRLILLAGAVGRPGDIHVLNMGQPMRIVDLARDLIRLSVPGGTKDIQITFTGLRPGEKLEETLFGPGEEPVPTDHEALLVARGGSAAESSRQRARRARGAGGGWRGSPPACEARLCPAAGVRRRGMIALVLALQLWTVLFVGFFGSELLGTYPALRIAAQLLFVAPLVIWAALRLRGPRNALDWAILAGLAALVLVSMFSADVQGSLESVGLALAYALTFFAMRDLGAAQRLRTAVAVAASYALVFWLVMIAVWWIQEKIAWISVFGSVPNLESNQVFIWGTANVFPILSLLAIPFLRWQPAGPGRRILVAIWAGASAIAIPLSAGRAGWLGLIAAAVAYDAFSGWASARERRRLAAAKTRACARPRGCSASALSELLSSSHSTSARSSIRRWTAEARSGVRRWRSSERTPLPEVVPRPTRGFD